MTRQPVRSSAARSIGYADGIVEIEYPSGIYRVEGVSPDEYAAVLEADSIGRALNALKADHPCTKVEPEKDDEA